MPDHLKTFVVPTGWSPNIGNAFFALGIKYMLEQAVPNAQVILFSDQAAYLNMLPGRHYRKEPHNSLHYLDHIRPDYIVLSGSVLTKQFPEIWQTTLEVLYRSGVKVLLISVGGYDYDYNEISCCRKLLEKYAPYVFISRDRETYRNFGDLASYSYNGIDGACFIPEIFKPIKTDLPPYIVLNFDKMPEPWIYIHNGPLCAHTSCKDLSYRFEFNGEYWEVRFPRMRLVASRILGKVTGFVLGPLGLYGTSQKRIGRYIIIRTDHQLNPVMIRKIFRGPNAYAGDIPYTYCNIYAQSELTLTDRIHAALVTMTYGRPAMLFSNARRVLVIERLGGESVTRRPTYLDLGVLKKEKSLMIDFLKSIPW
jgi:hypothetical protein